MLKIVTLPGLTAMASVFSELRRPLQGGRHSDPSPDVTSGLASEKNTFIPSVTTFVINIYCNNLTYMLNYYYGIQ